jgi:glutamyl-tRNA synthetase
MLRALGAPIPAYAHVPMILGPDGKRLSKRHGAVSVMQYREEGFLPEALLNYLVRLGWSHGDQEIFALDEMIELFDLDGVHSGAASFDPAKLLWLNQHYIKTTEPARVAHHLSWHMGRLGIDPAGGPELVEVVKAQAERAKTLSEMASASAFYYRDFDAYDEKDAAKHLTAAVLHPLADLRAKLDTLTPWSAEHIHAVILQVAETYRLKLGQLAQPLRVALAGRAVSPPIDVTTYLVGRERTSNRIERALTFIRERAAA